MTTLLNLDNISSSGQAYLVGPRISSLQITDSGYIVIDDTAVSLSGGYIKINGSNFINGCQVIIGNVAATSISFVNSTTLNVQVPAQNAGSYIVYVINGDGGYAILVNGLTYSGTPTWVTGSTLPDGYASEPISIQLSATGDAPLTYTLQAGSTLPTGLTLTSAGLLSGTVTLGTTTTYNFTIEAIDIQSQESPRAFQISIVVADPFFENVSLLMPGTSTSYTTRDASTNNFQITIFQDSKSTALNPFTTNWSNYFDGTGDYLQTPSDAAFNITGVTSYTIECWFYATSLPAALKSLVTSFNTTSGGSFYMGIDASNKMNVRTGNDASVVSGATTIVIGQWYHMALVRDGATSMKGYLNGVLEVSSTSFNWTGQTQACFIGSYKDSVGAAGLFTGYISNARVVNGTVVYTGAFTPPTSALTNITNTSLLTCQSNRFVDNSSNNFTITPFGNTSVSAFAPFTNAASNNGSMYFDGTGDYLSLTSAVVNATGDFTIEGWFNMTGAVGTRRDIFYQANATTGNLDGRLIINVNATGTVSAFVGGTTGAPGVITSTTVVATNTWYHFAYVRNSNTFSLYINGVREGTQPTGNISITQEPLLIGYNPTQSPVTYWQGYLSNLRVVQGTAVYTTNFAIPTSPLTAITNTSLLTLQSKISANNNSFVDDSGTNTLLSRFGNLTQGSFNPYGPSNWSVYFDGTGDYLTTSATPTLLLPETTSSTFECWVSTTSSSLMSIFSNFAAASPFNGVEFGINNGYQTFWSQGTWINNPTGNTGASGINNGAWRHLAWVITNNGTTLTTYIDGVQNFTTSITASTTGNATQSIGSDSNTSRGRYFNGYISNLRFVKGTALYTTNFTPSTQPLTAVANTNLLTCQSNRYIDSSTNNFTVTRNGDVRITNFSPFNPSASYSITNYSGCLIFDGNGDQVTASPTFLGLSNPTLWTFEGWFYPTSFRNTNTFMSVGTGGSIIYYLITIGSATGIVAYGNGTGGWGIGTTYTSTIAMQLNAWNHVAIVRNGTTLTFYINGASAGTNSGATFAPAGTGGTAWIGSYYNNYNNDGSWWGGYACDVRINVGQAIYSASFTPPTTPLTSNQFTVLLLNGTEGGLVDAAAHAPIQSFNQAGLSPAISKFGNGSMYFDGTNDYLMVENNVTDLYAFGSGNFTIEMWIYVNSFPGAGSYSVFYDSRATSTNGAYNTLTLKGSTLVYYANTADRITSGTLVINTWYFIALTRSGTSTRLFIDGTQVGSTYTDSTVYLNPADRPIIGGDGFGVGSSFNGYINDLRLTKGIARYTTTFTPPTGPFLTR